MLPHCSALYCLFAVLLIVSAVLWANNDDYDETPRLFDVILNRQSAHSENIKQRQTGLTVTTLNGKNNHNKHSNRHQWKNTAAKRGWHTL